MLPNPNDLPLTEPIQVNNSSILPVNKQAVAESMLPEFDDERKAAFLSYRASGFNLREAYKLVGVNKVTVEEWLHTDQVFVTEYESILSDSARTLRYIELEFLRNFRLMMIKDNQVIEAFINQSELSPQEMQYLLKARSYYTPQTLQQLRSLLSGKSEGGAVNFTQFVLNLQTRQPSSDTKDTVIEISKL